MKIVMISEALDFGGAERVEVEYANQLAKMGNDLILSVPAPFKERFEELSGSNVTIDSYTRANEQRFSMWRLMLIKNVLDNHEPDYIHTHETRMAIAVQMAKKLFVAKVKHVHTQHLAENWRKPYTFYLDRMFKGGADRFIAVSSAVKNFVVTSKHVPDKRVTVIPTVFLAKRVLDSAHRGKTKSDLQQSIGLPSDRPILLAVGRLTPQKGFEDAIDVAKGLKEQGIPFHLVICGEGPERQRLETDIHANGLQSDVTLIGVVQDVAKYYYAADVFMLTSRQEGMPVVLSEAMAAGLPVACYNVEGVEDIVKDGYSGLIIEKDDVKAMTTAVKELLSNPQLRNNIGANAENYVNEFIQHEALAKMLDAAYQTAI